MKKALEKSLKTRRQTADQRRAHVLKLFASGKNRREISRQLGVHYETIRRDVNKLKKQGSITT